MTQAAQTLSDRAYTHLEELIVTLQLPPGSAVSEGMLSKRLRIGRTPIREALQRLARERLVMILPRRGIVVSEINLKSQLRLRSTQYLLPPWARSGGRTAGKRYRAGPHSRRRTMRPLGFQIGMSGISCLAHGTQAVAFGDATTEFAGPSRFRSLRLRHLARQLRNRRLHASRDMFVRLR